MNIQICRTPTAVAIALPDVPGWFGMGKSRPPLNHVQLTQNSPAAVRGKLIWDADYTFERAPMTVPIAPGRHLISNVEYMVIAQGGPYTGVETFKTNDRFPDCQPL